MKKKKLRKKRVIVSILLLFILFVVSYLAFGYYERQKNGESKYLKINLNGDKEVVVKFGEKFEDLGASASYKDLDLTNKIETENNVDYGHIGTYSYKYTIKYKKHKKEIERLVKVVDDVAPVVELNGNSTVRIVVGNEYHDLGAIANDNYDKDLSDKIEVDTSLLNMNTPGDYKVIYRVKDSSGNEGTAERLVSVEKKPPANQKVAVINYHFFYKDWSEGCHESLCLRIDRFEEQLKYLNDNGYYTLTIKEFVDWMYGEIEIPEKSVLLTIDDGAFGTSKIRGNYLIPALEKYKVHATLFLITGWWGIDGGIDNYKSEYLDVQSHTHDLHYEAKCGHRSKVNCVSYDTLLKDLKQSIDVVKDTNSFCFPFYDYTEESIKAVKEAGFKVAFIGGYRKASRSDNKYKVPRYPVYDSTTLNQFINMIK